MLNAAVDRSSPSGTRSCSAGRRPTRPDRASVVEHEENWERSAELRGDLEALRRLLLHYAEILATVCEAPALIDATHEVPAALEADPRDQPG
jgi:hypothetical protein